MVVCFEIEENLEKKSNSLFERGVFFTFDMSTGVISKYVNWLKNEKVLKEKCLNLAVIDQIWSFITS